MFDSFWSDFLANFFASALVAIIATVYAKSFFNLKEVEVVFLEAKEKHSPKNEFELTKQLIDIKVPAGKRCYLIEVFDKNKRTYKRKIQGSERITVNRDYGSIVIASFNFYFPFFYRELFFGVKHKEKMPTLKILLAPFFAGCQIKKFYKSIEGKSKDPIIFSWDSGTISLKIETKDVWGNLKEKREEVFFVSQNLNALHFIQEKLGNPEVVDLDNNLIITIGQLKEISDYLMSIKRNGFFFDLRRFKNHPTPAQYLVKLKNEATSILLPLDRNVPRYAAEEKNKKLRSYVLIQKKKRIIAFSEKPKVGYGPYSQTPGVFVSYYTLPLDMDFGIPSRYTCISDDSGDLYSGEAFMEKRWFVKDRVNPKKEVISKEEKEVLFYMGKDRTLAWRIKNIVYIFKCEEDEYQEIKYLLNKEMLINNKKF